MGRGLDDWQIDHGMRKPGTQQCAGQLGNDIGSQFAPGEFPTQGLYRADGRVEVRTADRPKDFDEDVESTDCGGGVGGGSTRKTFQQGDRHSRPVILAV